MIRAVALIALLLPPSLSRADLTLGYSTDATTFTPPPLVLGVPTYEVSSGSSVDLHLFLLQTGGSALADNGDMVDLSVEGLRSIGMRLNYVPIASSASITGVTPLSPFTGPMSQTLDQAGGFGQVIAAVPFGTTFPTGTSFPLATFTFSSGNVGDTTAVSTAKPINPVFPDVFFAADQTHILDTDAFAPIRMAHIVTVPEPSAFVLFGFVGLLGVGGFAVSRWVPLAKTVI